MIVKNVTKMDLSVKKNPFLTRITIKVVKFWEF